MMGHLGYQTAIAHMDELRAAADKARRAGRAGRTDEPRRRRRWRLRHRSRVPQARRHRLT